MTNHNLFIIVVVVVLLLGGSASFFQFLMTNDNNTKNKLPVLTAEHADTMTTTTRIAPSVLRTYRNEEFGFEFSYPVNERIGRQEATPYSLLSFECGAGMLNDYGFSVASTSITKIEDLTDYPGKERIEAKEIKEQHYITLSGEQARVMTFNKKYGGEDVEVQIIHDGKLFSFMTDRATGLTDTILSTFHFVE